MRFIKHCWPLFVAVGLIYVFDNAWQVVPPLGKLFSPFWGYLQNTKKLASRSELRIDGIKEAVVIQYDDNGVPHIFAQNDEDLYLAQGYAVAHDRLWQMEFYTLVSAGRLTEVVGRNALALDRHNRRLGMARSAAVIAKRMQTTDTLSSRIAEAYAAGVNAYIDGLTYKELPIEYKLLNYRPQPWTPDKSILMLMNMRNTLSGGSNDVRLTHVRAKYEPAVVADLFPGYPAEESPMVPSGTAWDFTPVDIPTVPDTVFVPSDPQLIAVDVPAPTPGVGSNHWAVHGNRTITGLPMLANDPHLQLTLPSIWYQVQLSTPEMNAYGVTLPGTPAIIIGFTKDIAWGVTNVGSDVMDFYKIRLRDSTYQQYWHDGGWKPIVLQTETFTLKDGGVITDTLYYTHHGPIVYHREQSETSNIPVGYAMRWVANETDGSDMLTFHYLNRAGNYHDYRSALTYFVAPAQNFIFSSNENDIAITANGKFPLKWKGQGKFLLDGSMASHDWHGWIPSAHNPTVKNPPQGFLFSANQFPADTTYPYYLDWKFAHSSRALRINERLASMIGVTADSLRELQNDNYNIDARRILPYLLTSLSKDSLTAASPEFKILSRWDYRNEATAVAASIFEYWINALSHAIWDDEFPREEQFLYPSLDRTFELIIREPESNWFDNIRTAGRETLDTVVRQSFATALDGLHSRFGEQSEVNWAWGRVKNTRIRHLVPNFGTFGRSDIFNGGGGEVVNATTATHGPSWRMIVELDKNWPTAYGLYPGGQSGNPGSKYYDNMIDRWADGRLDTLLFLRNPEDGAGQLIHRFTLKPKKTR